MDHSLEGYLQRQSTQTLEQVLQQYRQSLEDPNSRDIVRIIEKILSQRQQPKNQ